MTNSSYHVRHTSHTPAPLRLKLAALFIARLPDRERIIHRPDWLTSKVTPPATVYVLSVSNGRRSAKAHPPSLLLPLKISLFIPVPVPTPVLVPSSKPTFSTMTQTQIDDAWFDAQIAPDDDPDEGNPRDEVQALKEYYYKKTTAEQAASAIVQPVLNSSDPDEELYPLWNLLIEALIEWPEAQIPALIQLLSAMEELPEPDVTGWPKKPWQGRPVWRKLYQFNYCWYDFLASFRFESDRDPARRAKEQPRYIRAAEIGARLHMADICDLPLDWGYQCCSDALESSSAVLGFQIPAAAKWILIAGGLMYKEAMAGVEYIYLKHQSHDLGWNSKVMDRERWMFWEKRMEEMTESPETRDAAKPAVEHMKALRSRSGDS